MHLLPRRHQAHAGNTRAHLPGQREGRRPATPSRSSASVSRKEVCAGWDRPRPIPVLTTLRYFREEYEAHIREGRCPAASCKALIHYRVLDSCTGCTLCAQACPAGAIRAPAVPAARSRGRPVHALRHVRNRMPGRCDRGRVKIYWGREKWGRYPISRQRKRGTSTVFLAGKRVASPFFRWESRCPFFVR